MLGSRRTDVQMLGPVEARDLHHVGQWDQRILLNAFVLAPRSLLWEEKTSIFNISIQLSLVLVRRILDAKIYVDLHVTNLSERVLGLENLERLFTHDNSCYLIFVWPTL